MLLAAATTLAAVALSMPTAAYAGGADRASRFEAKGKKAYGNKRWVDAIAAFDAAYRAEPVPK